MLSPAPVLARALSGNAAGDAEWTETHSGLKLRDVEVGEGAEATAGEFVMLRYQGRLADGTVFDDTLKSGQPLRYRHDRGFVVWGMDEGVGGMRAGGERELIIPPHLGYGFKTVGPIPANSELHFTVRLEGVGADAEPPAPSLLDSLQRLAGMK